LKPFSKLKPKGELGVLIGYTDELQSYRILADSGKIVETKSVQFLDYLPPASKYTDWDLLIEEEPLPVEEEVQETAADTESPTESNEEVLEALIPEPPKKTPMLPPPSDRTLQDCTSNICPKKYTHLTTDPATFKKAMALNEKDQWSKAAEEEISNIEHHEV
jgi:hypothetical protein